jgi:ectoine hydroxylase-related dioxygenase (phytanoyl-CoA dioxygenase family)
MRATVWLRLEVKGQYFWASLVGGISRWHFRRAKAAFGGDVWQWHQDCGTWARDDRMPETRAMTVAFLDEVMPINGPLLLIPKNHK